MAVTPVYLLNNPVTLTFTGGITPKGAYDNATLYDTGQSVSYTNGNSYVAIQPTQGNLPTDTTYWQLLASKGTTGATGANGADGAQGLQGDPGVIQTINGKSSATVTLTQDDVGDGTTYKQYSQTEKTKLSGIEANANNYSLPTAEAAVLGGVKVGSRLSIANGILSADVQTTDITGLVAKSLYDAYSILYATTDDTPVALTVGEQTIIGRKTGGAIAALTATEVRTILNVADGAIAGATKALDNLASVAINTSLISDTDSTDDLGSSSKYWANGYVDKIYLNSTVSLDGTIAGITNITGSIKVTDTLANANYWENHGAGQQMTIISPYDKYQVALQGSISSSLNAGRTNPIVGLDFLVDHYRAQTLAKYIAISATNKLEGTNAVVTNANGIYLDINFQNFNGQRFVNYYGININGPTSALAGANTATIDNFYGIYMPAIATTNITYTNKYGVYIGDTTVINVLNNISTTANANLSLIPNGTGYTIIGDAGTTSHTFNTNDDLLVSGRLEVDGITYLDGTTTVGGTIASDTDSTDNLGTSSIYFANTYTDKLYLNATATLDGSTAGIANFTGLMRVAGTCLNDDAWGTGGAGAIYTILSPYAHWQAALRGNITNTLAGTRDWSSPLIGLDFTVLHTTGYSLDTMYGTAITNIVGAASATITNLYGSMQDMTIRNFASQAITEYRGFTIKGLTSQLTGANVITIGTYSAFYMPALGSPTNVTITNRYGIYIADATASNYFAGTVQAGGYKSSDASAGITTTITTATLVGKTITIKNGLITGFA